jgi:transcription termination factor Rho
MSNDADTDLGSGVLELHPGGHGFLRDPARNLKVGPQDVLVGPALLARHNLRQGPPPSTTACAPSTT